MPTEPIRIIGIYEDAVATSQLGDSITAIVLRLSGVPDEEWKTAFHLEWGKTNYLRKRSVRLGSVRIRNGDEVRQGLVVSASPEDYVRIHKEHVERAVARANVAADRADRQQDETVAAAQDAIRQINAEFYSQGGPTARVSRLAGDVDRREGDSGSLGNVAA